MRLANTAASIDAGLRPLEVRVESVTKSFPQGDGRLEVLRDVSLTVGAGSFVSILGPSGSGKSTLLGILAGLEQPDRGSVTLLAQGATEPLSERLGNVGYMPQRDLLLPWRTAIENAISALEIQGLAKEEALKRARPLFNEFGLSGFANNYPHELSGGMRQRVSFLRSAIAARGLLLLDEPFGALDALTRAGLQDWLSSAAAQLGSTFVLVTHDLDEALLLSDRVYVLSSRPGRIVGYLEVDLPHPRSIDMAADGRLMGYRRELLDLLRGSGALLQSPEVVRA